ncbi:MAG: transcription-repair coupling factor [Christensenellales bacterium]
MLNKFLKNSNFKLLKEAVENGDNCSVFGLNKGEKLALLENSAFLFYVVESIDGIEELFSNLCDIGRTPLILKDFISPLSSEFEQSQNILETLAKIKNKEIDTLILTPQVLCARFPSPERINNLEIPVGGELEISQFIKKLVSFGYNRVEMVAEKGEFSVRGDVVDIYPLGGSPTRIMTDFDIVESIRNYNPITLLTTTDISSCVIPNNNYYFVTNDDIEEIYSNLRLKKDDLFYELTNSTKNDYRLIAFDKQFKYSIFDYVDNAVIAFDGAKNIYDNLEKYIDDYNSRIQESDLRKIISKININDTLQFRNHTLIAFHFIQQNNRIFKPQKVFSIRTLPAVNYVGHNNILLLDIENYYKQSYTIILCAGTNEQANSLSNKLNEKSLKHNIYSRITMCQLGSINIVTRKYPLDIILPEDKLAVISYTSLFGKPKKIIESVDSSYVDGEIPKEGDFVVHSFHGIGKCLGVKTLNISSTQRDYVVIEYKGNDKLYLPVENLNQLSKYIGSDKEPTINKIGGVEFAKTKSKIKSAVKKIAFDLIALYRERMNKKGIKYNVDDDLQREFENSFGYTETADQLKAIDDCKLDMESARVMDRLVCGDVGYGKTEVALRIAFKTILNGKQVALLCPTTILSEQHYNTAKTRMANFGVKIEVLNRLRSKTDEDKIKKDFSDGKIDLLCGTHKLLASDINYKNLGLLILDEEQKFGVADKEKIKNMKKNINVLTLSATPIPRTLNMSLIGVRDISIIETPPVERIASEVQVVEYSDTLVRNAIIRELERCGQVLIIYNRVEKIYNFASRIKNLVPEAVVSVAHGQMNEKELEKEILELYSGKTQILVATTLIENGVDLPNANTLIVINSDTLGLAQLYQLKGRIGRSNKSSYAYFTFDNRKVLTENAYKRLQAIKEFSGLCSGFKIAMRDLEIRGAGSILGAEQSGHIEKIGYNMYVELLSESVKELKGEKVIVKTDIKVETIYSAYLPHNYVESSSRRMIMYKEISNLDTILKLQDFITKTESVYGTLPTELINLCKIAFIKNRLSLYGVEKISIRKIVKIYFASKENLTKEIIDAINEFSSVATLNISDMPVVELKTNEYNVLDFIIDFIKHFDNF